MWHYTPLLCLLLRCITYWPHGLFSWAFSYSSVLKYSPPCAPTKKKQSAKVARLNKLWPSNSDFLRGKASTTTCLSGYVPLTWEPSCWHLCQSSCGQLAKNEKNDSEQVMMPTCCECRTPAQILRLVGSRLSEAILSLISAVVYSCLWGAAYKCVAVLGRIKRALHFNVHWRFWWNKIHLSKIYIK